MNIFFLILITCFLSISTKAREIGETEITTEDGIEVYQDEKYYLLKKNVVIESDNLILKIIFMTSLNSMPKVTLNLIQKNLE